MCMYVVYSPVEIPEILEAMDDILFGEHEGMPESCWIE